MAFVWFGFDIYFKTIFYIWANEDAYFALFLMAKLENNLNVLTTGYQLRKIQKV